MHRAEAELVLVLVTPHLLADDTLFAELNEVLKQGRARVIPILVKPVDWQSSPLASLPALPDNGQFIATAPNTEQTWLQIVQRLKHEILNADSLQYSILDIPLQRLIANYRYLVPGALFFIFSVIYLLGDRALVARTNLIGIANENFEYSVLARLTTGAQVPLGLARRVPLILGGNWPEKIAALVASALIALPLILRGRRRTIVLMALALPTLCCTVVLKTVIDVNHIFLSPDAVQEDAVVLGRSQVRDMQYEVANWVSNDSAVNDRCRAALGGVYILVLAAVAGLLRLSLCMQGLTNRWRRWTAIYISTYGVALLVLISGVPEAYALVHWGGVYPTVEEVNPACDATLATAVQQGACLLWDVSAGASVQVVMVSGSRCPVLHGLNSFRILAAPASYSPCIVRRGALEVVFAKG